MLRYLPLLLLTLFCTCDRARKTDGTPAGQTVTISNTSPRLTTDGKIVDAHDGRIIEFEGRFYWYGTQYGTTNGFTPANEYHVYRSDDLVTWEHLGPALQDRPEGVYYRPHVIHHAASGKYVFWYNWYPTLWDGHFGVAVSDSPAGPFEILDTNVQVANSELGVGDFGLFVDEDGTGYISYNTIQGHRVSVEKLTPDYLGSTMENGGYIAQYCEAGSMFRRNDIYYLLTDYTCCFCNQGAGARVYLADDPLGEWTLTNNINRRPGVPAPSLTDQIDFTTDYTALNRMPDSSFASLVVELRDSARENYNGFRLHVFTGDRSGQCGEVANPLVHERILRPAFRFEYYDHGWHPLPASDAYASDRNMLQDIGHGFTKEFPTRYLRITPTKNTAGNVVRLTEVDKRAKRAYVSNRQPGPIIIPAQQTYVMELPTATGPEFIWMGDMWGSASDNVKGHDFQYWSSPLRFDSLGWIAPLGLEGEWTVTLPDLGK